MLVGLGVSGGPLGGQAALVCGGTGLIGSEVVRALSRDGAAVAVQYRTRAAEAAALVGGLAGPSVAVAADLASIEGARAAVAQAGEQLGRPVSIVVDAASGALTPERIADLDDATVEQHLEALRMHVNVCRATVPGMRALGGGRVVLVSGALSSRLHPSFGLYSAVKAAATQLCRTLAMEEGRHAITVNVVAPGRVVETSAVDAGGSIPEPWEGLAQVMALRRGLDRDPSPVDVATTIAFLVSPAASAVTGQVVYLTGGEPVS